MSPFQILRTRLSLRLKRRKLQLRALRKGRELAPVADRTAEMPAGPILFSTVRNEAVRLPYFLEYYRNLGVVHFLIVDNASTDGTGDYLREQSDVSLWQTGASYKASRYGVDWLNALLARHGPGRWILVIDPDEFLVYPHCDTRRLPALTRWLEDCGADSFGTLLLDLYGNGPIADTHCRIGQDPVAAAPWFDAGNYIFERNGDRHNLWIQGGPRLRVFFPKSPDRAPALNKIPLVRWRRGFVYHAGAHDMLPRRLHHTYSRTGGSQTTGALLHAKFMDVLTEKVAEEMGRKQHYANSAEYVSYAKQGDDISLWTPQSVRYSDWQQLVDLGLMARGGWL